MIQAIFADLHNHTTFSDGDFTPAQLVELAREKKVKALGITDHDTLAGLQEGAKAADASGVEFIPGVEVSIRFKRPFFTGTLHLLCYFDRARLSDDLFLTQFQNILSFGRGDKLVKARVKEINKVFGLESNNPVLKRDMKFEDISSLSSNASRRHFAIALENSFGIKDKQVINSIIGNDSPAYLPSGIELSMMADFIGKNRMITALAHPAAGSFPGEGHYKEVLPCVEIVEKLLPEFLDVGMNGLEVFYPGHTPEFQTMMQKWADKHNLIITGGSDCHDKNERPFGVSGLSESRFHVFSRFIEEIQLNPFD